MRRLLGLMALLACAAVARAHPAAWLDARSAGAKGDGRADDSRPLQDALDAAKPGTTLYIPPGAYRVGAPLRLKSSLTLVGSGPTSILRYTGGGNALLSGTDVHDVRIADLALEGTKSDPEAEENGGIAVRLTRGQGDTPLRLTVERVSIAGFRSSGITVTGTGAAVATDVLIRDCTLADLGLHGVLGYFVRHYRVENCRFSRLGRSGTIFPRCFDVTVRDCCVKTTGWHGIEVGDETEGFLIEGNSIEDSGDHAGILVEQAAHGGVIRDNRISTPRFGGIQLNNKPAKAAVKQITVSGNSIDMGQNRARAAILIYGDTTYTADDCIIEGNTISGGQTGIEAHYLKRCRFDRNLIRGSGRGLDLVHLNTVVVSGNIATDCASEGIRVTPYAGVFANAEVSLLDNVLAALPEAPAKAPAMLIDALTGGLIRGNRTTGFGSPLQLLKSTDVAVQP